MAPSSQLSVIDKHSVPLEQSVEHRTKLSSFCLWSNTHSLPLGLDSKPWHPNCEPTSSVFYWFDQSNGTLYISRIVKNGMRDRQASTSGRHTIRSPKWTVRMYVPAVDPTRTSATGGTLSSEASRSMYRLGEANGHHLRTIHTFVPTATTIDGASGHSQSQPISHAYAPGARISRHVWFVDNGTMNVA
jgi:hypothetical protein